MKIIKGQTKKAKIQDTGITLVALIVTTIVLLILAGVTISLALKDNGLLKRVESASKISDDSQDEEKIQMAVYSAQMQGQGKIVTEDLERELRNIFKDEYGNLDGDNGWKYTKRDNTIYNISQNGMTIKQPSNIKIYGNNTDLPSEYREVYFIEKIVDVESWIDANIEIDLTSEVKFEATQYGYRWNNPGTYNGPVGGAAKVLFHPCGTDGNNGFQFGNYSRWTHSNKFQKSWEMAVFTLNKNGLKIVSDSKGEAFFEGRATSASGKVYPIGSPTDLNTRGYVHWFQHYRNNILEADLVSCYRISDGEIGLYDYVSKNFYTNQGTAALVKSKSVGLGKQTFTNKNEYVINLKITTISDEENINVVLKSPLRKQNNVTDYLDLKNKKVIRYIDDDDNVLQEPIEEDVTINTTTDIENIVSIFVNSNIKPSDIEIYY